MAKFVLKRNGSVEPFSVDKIIRAMLAAFHSVDPSSIPDVSGLAKEIEDQLLSTTVTIDQIQEEVEKALCRHDPVVARKYISYRTERDMARSVRKAPDARALMDYITVSKYARYDPVLGRREVYEEICDRYLNMHLRRFTDPEVVENLHRAMSLVKAKRILPSMRAMQFAGRAVEVNHVREYNCAFTHANRMRVFGEIFWVLLSGCGVGVSVQFRHVFQLPTVKVISKEVHHYTVEDTIEGWADAVSELVRCFYLTGKHIEFNYSEIRDRGAPLVTTGGRAPGHLPLKIVLENLRSLFLRAQGRQLRPIEVADAVCFLAEGVLAGGIRRSSVIILFSIDDFEMMTCKAHGNFIPNKVNDQRQMMNISGVCHRDSVTSEQFQRLMTLSRQWGEPGFFFTSDLDHGTNPCGEIGLDPRLSPEIIEDRSLDYNWKTSGSVYGNNVGFQFCNLCDINVAACATYEDFLEACGNAAFLGTIQATYTDMPYLGPVTEAVVRRDALLGVSLTGIMDNPRIGLDPQTLYDGAEMVLKTNARWADRLGINPAARLTTVKPGGTAPLVLGCVASGSTPHHSRRYFRRVTANPLEPYAQYFKTVNPHMVETKPNGDWSIIFCVNAPDEALTVDRMDAIDHMDKIFLLYDNWVKPGSRGAELTHNVSCTVVVDEDDWSSVIDHAWNNRHSITAMSFLPRIGDKLYPFAPRESVTTKMDEAKWNAICDGYTPVDWTKFHETEDMTNLANEPACVGGQCSV